MSSSRKQDVFDFVEKLFGLVTDFGGKPGMRTDELEALVRSDPETAAAAVFALLQSEEMMRGSRQLAFSVAAAYEKITGDDSLTSRAQRTIEESGGRMPSFRTLAGEGQELRELRSPEGIAGLQVDEGDLARGDIYNFLRIFRVDETTDPQVMAGLRGRCLLMFPVDQDPRPVWEIPEVRTFVGRLFEAMPYFPYFLDLTPESGSFMLFFGCLADQEAFQPAADGDRGSEDMQRIFEIIKEQRREKRLQGLATPKDDPGLVYINVMHPSVIETVSVAVGAVAAICSQLGENPRGVLEQLLAPYSPEIREAVLADFDAG